MEQKMIFKKMIELMREVGAIGKNSVNTQQKYSFRGIDDLLNAVHPALIKVGVFMTVEVLEKSETSREFLNADNKPVAEKSVSLKVRYTFTAEDGSSVSSTTQGEGQDRADKATNKAMSAALKYALIQTLSIPTKDMEDSDRDEKTTTSSPRPEVKKDQAAPSTGGGFKQASPAQISALVKYGYMGDPAKLSSKQAYDLVAEYKNKEGK